MKDLEDKGTPRLLNQRSSDALVGTRTYYLEAAADASWNHDTRSGGVGAWRG